MTRGNSALRLLTRAGVALAGLFLAVACAEFVVGPKVPVRGVRAIRLSAVQVALDDGQTIQLTATVLDQAGTPFEPLPAGLKVEWTSSATDLVSVDAQGMVTASRPGTAKVTASVSGNVGTVAIAADVTVRPVPTLLNAIAGDGQRGTVGQVLAQALRVQITDKRNDPVPDQAVIFTVKTGGGSLSTPTATTDAKGEAEVTFTLGIVAGPQTVEARTGKLASLVTFTAQAAPGAVSALTKVSGEGQSGAPGSLLAQPLVAKVSDRYGNGISSVTVDWTVATGGGTVSPASSATDALGTASAMFTLGPASGAQTVQASVGGVLFVSYAATAAGAVALVEVNPATASLTVGATQAFSATPKDAGGNALIGRTVTWTTSDATIATVSPAGLLTAIEAGTATVAATVEGVTGTATVTVTPLIIPVASVAVSPAGVSVAVGATQQYAATPKDAAGNPLSGRAVTWFVFDGTVASISPSGLLTAAAAGTTTVKATVEGIDGTASVTVTALVVPVASVEVSPAALTLASGATPQFTATPKDAGGTPLGGRTATWSSDNTAVASVDGAGLVQTVLVGTAIITATVEGVNGTATVTVTPGAVSPSKSVVTTAAASIASGDPVTLTLQTKDAAGNNLIAGGLGVVFTLSGGTSTGSLSATTDNGDGTYSATFTGVLAGTATTIGATIGLNPITSSLPTITVTPGPASTAMSLVTVSQSTVQVGQNATLTLRATDAAGNDLGVGGLTVIFTASGGSSIGTIGPTTDNGNGTYTATFTATIAGTPTNIGATIDGTPVTTVPPTITVSVVGGGVQWILPASGLWSVGTNWSTGTPPGPTEVASITLDGTYTVTLDVSPTVAGLSLGGTTGVQTLSASSRTLTLNGATTISANGVLSLSSSTVAGSGSVTNQGTVNLTGRTIIAAFTNEGTLTVAGSVALNGALTTVPGSTIRIQEYGTQGGALLTVANGFSNAGAIELTSTIASYGATLTVTTGTLLNAATGTITALAGTGGPRTLTAQLTNQGTVTVALAAGQAFSVTPETATDVLRNDGTFTLSGGDVSLSLFPGQRFTNAGTLTVGVGTTLSVIAGRLDNTGTLAGGGTIDVSAAALGGTLQFGGTVSPGSAPGSAGTLTVIGDFEATDSGSDRLQIELGGIAAGSQYDRLAISGNADFSGATMNVSLINGFTPAPGQSFTVMTHASLGADFGTINLPTLPTGPWQVNHTQTALVLTVPPTVPTVAAIAINAGDGQTAPPGGTVPVAPSVLLTDASFNPVPGVQVDFAVGGGGGSVTGASPVSDVNGIATVGSWTLGPASGPNTLTATAVGASITGNPVTFLATGTVPPVARTWTGAVSTDWSDPNNWSPAGVPSALDNATIEPATNQPTLTASSLAANVTVRGNGARLTIGGQTLSTGYFTVHTDGLLVMTNPADQLIVSGDANFQGGNESGLLTAGLLRLAGSFNQTVQTDTRSFTASGTHRVVLNGTTTQGVRFSGSAGASGFQDLDISNAVEINIQFSVFGVPVFGTLVSQVGAGPAPVLYGLSRSLTAARFQVDKLVADRALLVLNEGGTPANQQFDNVTFRNFATPAFYTTLTQLTIVAPGGAGPARSLTFNNLSFSPLTAGNTGRYLNVTATIGSLILDLPGANALVGGNGPAFTTTSAAVTVNW